MTRTAHCASLPISPYLPLPLPASQLLLLIMQNSFFRKWDIVVVLAVLFTASVTPFEVAFLKTSLNALFIINRIIDVIFLFVSRCWMLICFGWLPVAYEELLGRG